MAARSSLTQVVQWGLEPVGSTATTGVDADTLMSAMGFEPSPRTSGGDFRPAGQKFKTLAWVGKEWAEGSISGQATYTEIIYPLSSVLTAPSTASPTGNCWTYTFTPATDGPDTPRTFTIEHGEDNNYAKITGVIINEFSMSFTRDAVELSGSAFGRAMSQNNDTMTTVSNNPPATMLLPADVSVYWADSYSAITGSPGPTGAKLDRALTADIQIGDRYNPVWVLDADQDSYVASVEGEPSLTASLLVEADTEGMAFLDDLKNSTTKFLRINATSSTAVTGSADPTDGFPYMLDIYMAVKVADTNGFNDQDGLYAIEWSCTGIYDATLGGSGGAISVVVQNGMSPASYPLNA